MTYNGKEWFNNKAMHHKDFDAIVNNVGPNLTAPV